jgi:hypothetical protein
VIYDSESLGYVVATSEFEDICSETVFTYYYAMTGFQLHMRGLDYWRQTGRTA